MSLVGPRPHAVAMKARDHLYGEAVERYLHRHRVKLGISGDYSGLLSTEWGLVFGASGGGFFAVDADTGREVWRVSLGGNTKSAPISFMVDGRQVIAVAAGHALFVFGL